jgi:hypothetical protein
VRSFEISRKAAKAPRGKEEKEEKEEERRRKKKMQRNLPFSPSPLLPFFSSFLPLRLCGFA